VESLLRGACRYQKSSWIIFRNRNPPGYLQLLAERGISQTTHCYQTTNEREKKKTVMGLHLNDDAPDFTAETTKGEISFYEWLGGHWGILFSHPADFTPVCTTELGAVARLKQEFDRRGTKVLALSVDPVESHLDWVGDIAETQGSEVEFPIIADPDHKVADLYDMIQPQASNTSTVRSVFIIGPDKKIKLMLTYPAAVGRNFAEILRALDALQLTESYPVVTPADWQVGSDVIVSLGLTDGDAHKRFPQGFREIKPYLRMTAAPQQ
jgi:alkyl hydroperoxide reductase subunit AhpC